MERIAEAVNALIENRAQQSAEAELREAVRHLETVLDQIRDLAPSVRPFFEALLRQVVDRGTHQKSLLASVSRAGSWWNFDVYHALGSGAAEDANLRAREAYDQIRIALKNLIKDGKYASCQKFLIALSESAETWFENFLTASRTVAMQS